MAFRSAAGRPGRWVAGALILALCATGVSACGGNRAARTFQSQDDDGGGNPFRIFRERSGGQGQQAASPSRSSNASGPVIGVNAYLWRAALDTLGFMPMSSYDPYTGIIMSDWYTAPETPNERFKATVYILDTRLRADGISVAIHRQVRQGADWQDAATTPTTEEAIENAILTRARQIRTSGR